MDIQSLTIPMQGMWAQVASAVPHFFYGLIILLVGLFASSVLASLTHKLIKMLKLDGMFLQFGAVRKAEDAGWKVKPSYLISKFVKWFFIAVTLIALSEHLGLTKVSELLTNLVAYLPNVVVAVILLAVGFVVGNFVHDLVKQSMKSSNFGPQAMFVGPRVAKYAVLVFVGLAAATQLNIAQDLIYVFFVAICGAFALAAGIAFGLGGKEHASRMLDELTHRN